jgi:signal peptidase I
MKDIFYGEGKMKKLIIFNLLLLILVLSGCELHPTKTVQHLEYVETVKTSKGDIIQFRDKEGYKINYFIDPSKSFNLEKSKTYDVTITVNNEIQNGDFITEVKSN